MQPVVPGVQSSEMRDALLAALRVHADWIGRETLALSVEVGDGDDVVIARRAPDA